MFFIFIITIFYFSKTSVSVTELTFLVTAKIVKINVWSYQL